MYKCDEGIAGIMLKLNSNMMTNISDGTCIELAGAPYSPLNLQGTC